jgi:hypothetical protein
MDDPRKPPLLVQLKSSSNLENGDPSYKKSSSIKEFNVKTEKWEDIPIGEYN